MKQIRKIEPSLVHVPELIKVAAYARVSMECERLQHSLSAQVSYYSERIQKHQGWQYAGVYADNGISGTKTVKRDEFNRMLQDCEAGKIDIILTKSISRFARNTVDLLKTVRHLKELGISIRFEKENIDSLSEDGELMLTLLASLAQDESRSISDNVKWGTVKRFQQGIPNGQMQIFGYEWVDGRLSIVPKEAEIIRFMYDEYMKGASRIEIGRALNDKGIFTRQGKLWVDSNVKVVLTNITYTGNMLFQKEYTVDPISKRRKKNRGELPQYFTEATHEAIIPMEEFQEVQAEFKRRRDLGPFGNKSLHLTAFSTKITCSVCGKHYRRSGKRNTAGDVYYIWTCQTKNRRGIAFCNSKNIPEKELQKAAAEVLGLSVFDSATFTEQIEEIIVVSDDTLKFRFYDGHEVTKTWVSTAKTDWWTPERRKEWGDRHKDRDRNPNHYSEFTCFIKCGTCGANYRGETYTIKDGTKIRVWRCQSPRTGQCAKTAIKEDILKALIADVLGLPEYDSTAFVEQFENATVVSDGVIVFRFRDGHEVSRNYASKRKMPKHTEERNRHMSEVMKAIWRTRHGKNCNDNTSDNQ